MIPRRLSTLPALATGARAPHYASPRGGSPAAGCARIVHPFVSDPLPVNVAISEGAEVILAMGFESPHHQEVRSPVRFAFQLSSIMTNNLMRSRYALHHLTRYGEVIPVMPEFREHIGLFDASKSPYIIEEGERATVEVMPTLLAMLGSGAAAA